MRTLVNVGELGPGEERRPADEIYRLENDEFLRRLLENGETYMTSLDDPDIIPLERDLLLQVQKHHALAVPVQFAGGPWGELWATRRENQDPFTDRDARFLQTVAGQVAAAVGRAELFSRMSDLAFEDPLTGVANRRAHRRAARAVGHGPRRGRAATWPCSSATSTTSRSSTTPTGTSSATARWRGSPPP